MSDGSRTPGERIAIVTVIMAVLCLASQALFGQVYSYLDENGIRVFTNIAPTGAVQDLKVTGALPSAPEPPAVSKGKAQLQKSQGVPRGNTNSTAGVTSPARAARTDPKEYDDIINKYAAEFSLDPKLLQAMINTESAFNPKAVSPKGAQGLMQLMPDTAVRLGVNNPFDPEQNIWGGARYMKYLLDMFATPAEDSLILSLAAYNAGENLVQSLGRVPNIRETNDYVSSIIQRYGKRKMDVTVTQAPPAVVPRIIPYLDERGVLILTNIPPVDRSRSNPPNTNPILNNR
jgi:hypothetical protein